MTSNKKNIKRERLKLPLIIIASLLILILPSLFLISYYQSHFLPQTRASQLNIGHLTFAQAQEVLNQHYGQPEFELTLLSPEIATYSSSITNSNISPEADLDFQFIASASSEARVSSSAAELGFTAPTEQFLTDITTHQATYSPLALLGKAIQGLVTKNNPLNYVFVYQFDEKQVLNFINQLKTQVDKPGTPASIALTKANNADSLEVDPGTDGHELDVEQTLDTLRSDWQNENWITTATITSQSVRLNDEQTNQLTNTATKLVGKSIKWTSDNLVYGLNFSLNDQDLISCLDPYNLEQLNSVCLQVALEPLHQKVDRPARNAEFSYDPQTLRVNSFTPPQDGLTFNETETLQGIQNTYLTFITAPDQSDEKTASTTIKNTQTLELSAAAKPPTVPLASTNDLGINELIGFGESYYAGSIAGRVHNVALAANRVSLHIVRPGEEFSFNQALGDVSAETGFQPGYIISGGRSVLSDGGGVCQVSSTLFRALLDSGVKVTKRLPHSYRVSYYELNNDPGFDATVYSGNIDLRFKNDTPGHILIYMTADSKSLYMTAQLYGTDDGRTTEVIGYRKYDAVPAPPTEYITDESLAPGQKQQIDWATPGLKVTFTNVIRDKNGQEIGRDTYQSNYRAWSAKFLVGP